MLVLCQYLACKKVSLHQQGNTKAAVFLTLSQLTSSPKMPCCVCTLWAMRTSTQLGFLPSSSSSLWVTKHENTAGYIYTSHQCIIFPSLGKKKWHQLHFYFGQPYSHGCYLTPTPVGFGQLCLQASSLLSLPSHFQLGTGSSSCLIRQQ